MYAIVTGGSRGLGYHLAKELKKRGYDIILIAKDEKRLKKTAKSLDAKYYALDLAKNYKEMKEIIKKYSPHVVVNNAGFGIYGKLKNQDWERIREMLNVNVYAVTYITKIALENMEEGYILNIASVAACGKQKNLSVYAATKAYVAHLSKCIMKEQKDIHISYLLLGPTRTDFFKNANMPTGYLEKLMMDPDKVARYTINKMFKGKRKIVPGWIYKFYCLMK